MRSDEEGPAERVRLEAVAGRGCETAAMFVAGMGEE